MELSLWYFLLFFLFRWTFFVNEDITRDLVKTYSLLFSPSPPICFLPPFVRNVRHAFHILVQEDQNYWQKRLLFDTKDAFRGTTTVTLFLVAADDDDEEDGEGWSFAGSEFGLGVGEEKILVHETTWHLLILYFSVTFNEKEASHFFETCSLSPCLSGKMENEEVTVQHTHIIWWWTDTWMKKNWKEGEKSFRVRWNFDGTYGWE